MLYSRTQLSITSETGAGSSTLLEGLRNRYFGKFPYRFVSGGAIMRAKAHAAGMSIEDFAAYNRRCPEAGHDRDCDQMIERFAEHDFVICEGRLPHFFMRNAFHVLLVCDLQVRVKRRKKQVGFEHLSDAEIMQAIIDRDRDDGARYRALYGNGCVWAPDMFGLVVDSTELSKEVTLARVVKGYEEWQQQPALV